MFYLRKGGLLLNNILGIGGACLMWCTKITNSYEVLFLGRFIIGVNCGKKFIQSKNKLRVMIDNIDINNSPSNVFSFPYVRLEHLPRPDVHIRDRPPEPSRRPRHRQPAGGNRRPPPLSGARHRADTRHQRRLAASPRSGRLPGPAAAGAAAGVPREPQVPADHAAVGGGGAQVGYCEENRVYSSNLLSDVCRALRRLRASNQVEEDIEEMRAEERAQQAEASISMMELICSPTLRAPLIIGVVMQLSQQLSGINAVGDFFCSLRRRFCYNISHTAESSFRLFSRNIVTNYSFF